MKNRYRMKVVAAAWAVYLAAVTFVYLPLVLSDPTRPENTEISVGFCLAGIPILFWSEWQKKKYVAGLVKCPECDIPLERVGETATASLGKCPGCVRVHTYEKKPPP